MRIPKAIAKKVRRHARLLNEVNKLHEELSEYFNAIDDGVWYDDFYIVNAYKAKLADTQGDNEFCHQVMEFEDSGYGTYYYPIENSKKFVAVDYHF